MTATDPIDERILQTLRRVGRVTNAELAERVGLSASATSRRVAALEERGAIQGYAVRLSPEARGIAFIAYVAVGLGEHTKSAQSAFERAMATARQVTECHNVTGTIEYLLRVEVADLTAYKHFHTEVLGTLPHVSSITSYVVMGSPKDERS